MLRHPLIQLVLIRYKEFFREPGIVFWAIIFPILMAWVLGVAFGRQQELVQNIALVQNLEEPNLQFREFMSDAKPILNEDKTEVVGWIKSINNEKIGRISFRFLLSGWEEGILKLKRGQAYMILEEYPDSMAYHFDPQNPESKLSYILLVSAIENEELVYRTGGIQILRQTGTRYIDFLIPGLIAMGIMNSILWGISYALIDMRSKKLLRRMVATPMRKSHFLISHFFGRLTLTILEALILFYFARALFDIEIQGSLPALALMFLTGNIAFAGFAILISSRTANSRVGTGLINLFILPMTVLSGIFFSYSNFPETVIPIIKALPLTLLADSIRSIFIEGTGLLEVLPEAGILSGMGLVCFLIGLRIYKWY